MNILIIGCHGFIGSYLCNYFVSNSHTVYGIDVFETPANLKYIYLKVSRLSSQWEQIMKAESFNICINASGSGNVPYSLTHPLIDFEANTLDVIRILDALKEYQPTCKYVHISSAAVYGNPDKLPIAETGLLQPISPYGFHKMMSETICQEYSKLFKVPIVVVRPFSIYGIGLRKQLLWDICNKLSQNDEITMFGTGNETRDFIHISDFVFLIDLIIQHSEFKGETYNAASGKETSIKEIVSIFNNYYSFTKKISFNQQIKEGDPLNWLADISAIKDMGFRTKTRLENAVLDYIEWFKNIYAKG